MISLLSKTGCEKLNGKPALGIDGGDERPRTPTEAPSWYLAASSASFDSFFPSDFQSLVGKHRAERGAKGFACWDQFVAMLFCQLGRAHSLREICGGLASARASCVISAWAPRPSVDAHLRQRPSAVGALRGGVPSAARRAARRSRLQARSASRTRSQPGCDGDRPVPPMFDWAKFRRTKGAVKLHLLLDHEGCLPGWAVITEGKMHEVRMARNPAIPARHDRGDGPRLHRLRLFAAGRAGRVLRHPAQGQRRSTRVEARPLRCQGPHPRRPDDRTAGRGQSRGLPGSCGAWWCGTRATRADRAADQPSRPWPPPPSRRSTRTAGRSNCSSRPSSRTCTIKTFVGTSANAVQHPDLDSTDRDADPQVPADARRFGWRLSNLVALLRSISSFIAISGPGSTSPSHHRRKWTPPDTIQLLLWLTWTAS